MKTTYTYEVGDRVEVFGYLPQSQAAKFWNGPATVTNVAPSWYKDGSTLISVNTDSGHGGAFRQEFIRPLAENKTYDEGYEEGFTEGQESLRGSVMDAMQMMRGKASRSFPSADHAYFDGYEDALETLFFQVEGLA